MESTRQTVCGMCNSDAWLTTTVNPDGTLTSTGQCNKCGMHEEVVVDPTTRQVLSRR
jgi:transcription elongation factor Elf1